MNKTILTGNLGNDAEVKTTQDGQRKFLFFNIANTEKFGETETTTWYKCYIQNQKIVESKLVDFLKKGKKVLIEGKMSARNWNKDDGTIMLDMVISVHSLEFIGGTTGSNQGDTAPPLDPRYAGTTPQNTSGTPESTGNIKIDTQDDDLPF